MITCKDCKHWGTGPNYDRYEPDGEHPHRICALIVLGSRYDEGASQLPAYTEDASGYKADLFTRPDFGCLSGQCKQGGT